MSTRSTLPSLSLHKPIRLSGSGTKDSTFLDESSRIQHSVEIDVAGAILFEGCSGVLVPLLPPHHDLAKASTAFVARESEPINIEERRIPGCSGSTNRAKKGFEPTTTKRFEAVLNGNTVHAIRPLHNPTSSTEVCPTQVSTEETVQCIPANNHL